MRDASRTLLRLIEPDWDGLASLAEEIAAYFRCIAAVPAFVARLLESWATRVRRELRECGRSRADRLIE